MSTSNSTVEGKFNEVAGKVKQGVGEAFNNDELANEGAAQRVVTALHDDERREQHQCDGDKRPKRIGGPGREGHEPRPDEQEDSWMVDRRGGVRAIAGTEGVQSAAAIEEVEPGALDTEEVDALHMGLVGVEEEDVEPAKVQREQHGQGPERGDKPDDAGQTLVRPIGARDHSDSGPAAGS